ncbi:isoprenylcysteine carboxylmethyltransferase family protein [Aureimonas sp. AU22]|uniref:methyltransferase family protein n=1 Tax=Aureimonas sp. AU22 TaxID=1638162 RepID=UPI0007860433|nr:isoprenylcysteine carboxylmethyltransferase family protein [Aureimonas sp. AU22]
MNAAVDDLLRFGPAVVLAVTVAWLALATCRTSREIGGRAYGFGRSIRQTLARILFAAAVVGGLVALGLHAVGSASAAFAPLAGEATAVRLAGLALAVAGQVLTVVAMSEMGRRWRVGIPDEAPDVLVTTGLFGLSRNPVFLGMLAMASGLAVAVPSPAAIACALAFWIGCEVQVRDEERFLERSFGPAYTAYRSAVRRWI